MRIGVALVGALACLLTAACAGGGTADAARPLTAAATTTTPTSSAPPPTTPPAGSPTPGPPAPSPPAPDALPPYAATISPVDAALAARMQPTTWRPECPVALDGLRYLTIRHVDFSGTARDGEIVVAAGVAQAVTRIFHRLYDAGYPIRSLRLVDDYGGDDNASMAADNSSGFNCRPMPDGAGWSEHAYGTAIDLNPVENPFLSGGQVQPPAGAAYVERVPAPGVILPDDAVVQAFAAEGWSWGGAWTAPVDYQHFSLGGH